jgi:hypothetical protein
MLFDTGSWSNTRKTHFLAVLAHELTVCARGTYEVGTAGVLEPELLRAFNELEHRVTSSLRDYLRGTEGMPLDAVLQILTDFGARYSRKKDVQHAISRAQELTMRDQSEGREWP